MVRLRVPRPFLFAHNANRFQFQNGAIERMWLGSMTDFAKRFQFQNGAIESAIAYAECVEGFMFQFQNGAIERKLRDAPGKVLKKVSIPKWCD